MLALPLNGLDHLGNIHTTNFKDYIKLTAISKQLWSALLAFIGIYEKHGCDFYIDGETVKMKYGPCSQKQMVQNWCEHTLVQNLDCYDMFCFLKDA